MKKYRQLILNKYLSQSYAEHDKDSFLLGNDLKRNLTFFKYNFLKLLPADKKSRFLELGPGNGQFCEFLRLNGYNNYVGIDGSEEAESPRKTKGYNIICTDFLTFCKQPENQNAFDVVIANDIIEHFTKEELFDLFGAIRNCLKEKGTILIKTPNASNIFTGAQGRYCDLTHEIIFTEKSLKQLFISLDYDSISFYESNLFCFYWNPLNYLGWCANFILRILQLLIHRLHGNFETHIFGANIIAKVTK